MQQTNLAIVDSDNFQSQSGNRIIENSTSGLPTLTLVDTSSAQDDGIADGDVSPERIYSLSAQLAREMHQTFKEIEHVNSTIRLLALNAKIEAARAGSAGAAFGVVATEINSLSERTMRSTSRLVGQTQSTLSELQRISDRLTTDVRGIRLSDLALTNIDLIDRNLYERSCDVRWWATDSSAVEALADPTAEKSKYAGRRFAQILSSYTVYLDLVLCDLTGKVIANGRPETYHSVGMNAANNEWFTSAVATESGEEFGFQSVHGSQLVNGRNSLVYSCCVREEGKVNGTPLGVLGILFNWDALGQTIVDQTPLAESERLNTQVCIVDSTGAILADSKNGKIGSRLRGASDLIRSDENKTYVMADIGKDRVCVGYAAAPGFETYTTGWHSLILQTIVEE